MYILTFDKKEDIEFSNRFPRPNNVSRQNNA